MFSIAHQTQLTPRPRSQNLGHESEATTFVGYGHVPAHRQSEIMRALAKPRQTLSVAGLDIDALENFIRSAKEVALASADA